MIARDKSARRLEEATATGGAAGEPGPDATGGAVADEEPADPGTEPGTEPEEPTLRRAGQHRTRRSPPPSDGPASEPDAASAPISDAAVGKAGRERRRSPSRSNARRSDPAPGPATG